LLRESYRAAPSIYFGGMAEKTYLVRLKPPDLAIQQVVAVGAQIQGEHLVFVDSSGKLAGLFHLDLVESWTEISPDSPAQTKVS
jgi:hypothetical protein